MEDRHALGSDHRPACDSARRVMRWLRALAPLLDRDAPLSEAQAAAWRRRLPALIASGEVLRYQCSGTGDAGLNDAAAALLQQALLEARALQAELGRDAPGTRAVVSAQCMTPNRELLREALAQGQELVCRSAALREVEELLQARGEGSSLVTTRTLSVPPGRVPGLRGFNLCFFVFLLFQTLVWGGGALHGAEPYALVLYALILAPFWWWGSYLLTALVLALTPEQLRLAGRQAVLQRRWPRPARLELAGDAAQAVRRECWFEINHSPVHCLTLCGTDGRRLRFAVGRDAQEHERLQREIEAHLAVVPGG